MRVRTFLGCLALALVMVLLPSAPAHAGRLIVTGHDADFHCAFGGPQCHYVEVAVRYVRSGAPDPSRPVLVLDNGQLQMAQALDDAFGAGVVPRVVIDPRSPEFPSAPIDTGRYSAILIASDQTCGGCDLNIPIFGGSETPDSDAINARAADIAAFFNSGGGIFAASGAEHGDGDPNTGPDIYYSFLPLPLGGAPVSAPFTLTDAGKSLGFEDSFGGYGTHDDINCCATHNSFTNPDPSSALQIAEFDSQGKAETLFADGVVVGGQIRPPDTTPPETAAGVGVSGLIRDRTATFTFSSDEPGASFECSLDGAPFSPCTSPLTLTGLAAGPHTLSVRARDAAGNVDPTPAVFTFSVARTLADLPAPALGVTMNVAVVRGTVLIGVPAGAAGRGRARASQKGLTFVPLEQARQVPVGSFLDTKRGTVELVSATGSGARTQSGKFSSGLFQVLQSRRRSAKGLTELRLKGSSFNRCRARGGAAGGALAAQLSRRTIRRLRSSARGSFRTRGRHSAATIRGTVWVTADRCDGTLTTVKRGKVAVRDFRRKRTVTLTTGKSYLARAPR